MSKLSKLYQMLDLSESLKQDLTEAQKTNINDIRQQINELEEEIIKKEILPIVQKNIEPALKQVRRDLVMVVEYSPDKPLTLKLSRKIKLAEKLEGKIIEPDPQVEHRTQRKTQSHTVVNPRTRLRITLADGRIIEERNAAATLVEFVKHAGIMPVRNLGIIISKVPLVSNTLDNRYRSFQHPVGNGWYVMTNSSTATKKKLIEKIAAALNIPLTVTII